MARVPTFVVLSCVVLLIVAIATPFWLKTDVAKMSIARGLFNFCITSSSSSSLTCDKFSTVDPELAAVRAFAVLALLFSFFGLITDIIFRVRAKTNPPNSSLSTAAVWLPIIACFSGIIAIAIFFDFAHDSLDDLSWSFAFFAVGIFLGVVNSFWIRSSHAAYIEKHENAFAAHV